MTIVADIITDGNRHFNSDEKNKLKQLINEGMAVTSEVETLQSGLRDTVKAIGEELSIKPSVINKAIRTAYKAEYTQQRSDFELLESILEATGKTI